LASGSSLANFQEQLKGLGQQLGLNGTLLSQLCRFCKDIIEVNKAGERYIIIVFSGGVKEYEHWKCYQQQMFTKVLQNIFGGADNYI